MSLLLVTGRGRADGTPSSPIDPGVGDTIAYDEDFDGVTALSDLTDALATKEAGATPWFQFTGPEAGSEREAVDAIVTPGYGGSSACYRITTDYAAQIEPSMYGEIHRDTGEAWATNPPGSTLFVDLWVRLNLTNTLWVKGLELFHDIDRTQYGIYNSSASLGWANIHPQSNNREIYMHLEDGAPDAPVNFRRWADVNDNDWHRWTCVYAPSSSPGNTDGAVQMYVDGEKIIDGSLAGHAGGWMVDRVYGVDASSTDPYPGNVGERYTNVTGLQALQGLSDDAVTGRLIFPGIFRGLSASGGGTLDVGRIRVWYRP